MKTRVRALTAPDQGAWQSMRRALWPDIVDDAADAAEWLARPDAAVFIAVRDDGAPCGFVEVGARSYAEHCDTSPVGYIEGWYVQDDMRRHGVGRALLEAAEDWARAQGYTEMGSDALLDNRVSHSAHQRCGYEETERLVTFKKQLR